MDTTPGELQGRLDALSYAPNHCYDLVSMEGKNGVSADRFAYLTRHLEGLVEGRDVLDVGCNKGFVSLWCASHGARRVVAEDIRAEYPALVSDLAREKGLENVATTAKSLWQLGEVGEAEGVPVTKEGDLALVLGVAHHLTFKHGLDWLWRLYFLGYDILMEFPVVGSDRTVEGCRGKVPEGKRRLMTEEGLREKVGGLYEIELVGRSPDLGRPLYHLRKMPLPAMSLRTVEAGPVVAKGKKSQVYRVGGDGAGVVKSWHRQQRDGKGYALRWVRAQQVLSKQFPGTVAGVRALVETDGGVVEGLVEDFQGGEGFAEIGVRALFDIQLFLLSLGLIALDFHLSSVVGASVVDHELIEVLTPETESYFRQKVKRTWEFANVAAVRGRGHDGRPGGAKVSEAPVRAFRRAVVDGLPLESVLRRARGFRWFNQASEVEAGL